jgi:hypothetical protein
MKTFAPWTAASLIQHDKALRRPYRRNPVVIATAPTKGVDASDRSTLEAQPATFEMLATRGRAACVHKGGDVSLEYPIRLPWLRQERDTHLQTVAGTLRLDI